jgi:hypothetical protein
MQLYQWITAGPGNHKVKLEIGLEGTLGGAYDSRVAAPNAVSSLSDSCPAADPNDFLPDDEALQWCLDAGGVIALSAATTGPGYLLTQGLVLSKSNTTLIGRPGGTPVVLLADPLLDAPMLRVEPTTVSNYTISSLHFDGNRTQRTALFRCAQGYDLRTHGYNVLLRGSTFLVEKVDSSHAMCGSAMEISGDSFWIRFNHLADNGFQEGEVAVNEAWSDGITAGICDNGAIYSNTLVDNTDVDLIVGPHSLPSGQGSLCIVQNNSIQHVQRYGYAGLMSGFGGNHFGMIIRSNTVTSALNKLSFGVMVGHHPWDDGLQGFTNQDFGEVGSNTTTGSVTPLAIDGITSGQVTGNSPSAPQGTNGFQNCTLSAVYTAADYGTATVQPGGYWRTYHFGNCTP